MRGYEDKEKELEAKTGASSGFGQEWGVIHERIRGLYRDKEKEICGLQSILRNVILSFQMTVCIFRSPIHALRNDFKMIQLLRLGTPSALDLNPKVYDRGIQPSKFLGNVAVNMFVDRRFNNTSSSSRVAEFGFIRKRWVMSGKMLAMALPANAASSALISSVADLYEFICRGPLLKKTGSDPQEVANTIDRWLECGVQLCRLLGFNELLLTEAQKVRIYHYYAPVYLWCERELSQHRAKFKDDAEEIPPLVFGVSAPQGSGKTTLVFALDHLFNITGRKTASISIDDFYLTAADQAKLAGENAGNTLLELRGNAGSHDLALGADSLNNLCSLTQKGTKAKIPRYDKSAYNGRGDRADPCTWPEIEGPLEVVLLEGWMLGFKPLSSEVVKAVDPQLEVVNRNLESYYDAWEKFIGSWILIKVDDTNWVYEWRLQAEIAMREEGKPGMSDEQVADFVSRYMPAYKAYLPVLYSDGPRGSKPDHTLVVEVDEHRNPLG